jgi:hypothetical protein
MMLKNTLILTAPSGGAASVIAAEAIRPVHLANPLHATDSVCEFSYRNTY